MLCISGPHAHPISGTVVLRDRRGGESHQPDDRGAVERHVWQRARAVNLERRVARGVLSRRTAHAIGIDVDQSALCVRIVVSDRGAAVPGAGAANRERECEHRDAHVGGGGFGVAGGVDAE